MIKAVVFDLDHTLYDRYETLKLAVPLLREKFRFEDNITDEYFRNEICWADRQYVHHGWEEILEHLVKCEMFKVNPDIKEYTEAILSCFSQVAVPFDFTLPMLENLKKSGYKTGLITNGRHEVQHSKLKMLGLQNIFDAVVISGDYEFKKPDRRIFEKCAELLDVKTSEMMYVGDHPKFDVEGSENAGCVPVWVKTTGTWIYPEIEKPMFQVETVKEIPEIVERYNNGR